MGLFSSSKSRSTTNNTSTTITNVARENGTAITGNSNVINYLDPGALALAGQAVNTVGSVSEASNQLARQLAALAMQSANESAAASAAASARAVDAMGANSAATLSAMQANSNNAIAGIGQASQAALQFGANSVGVLLNAFNSAATLSSQAQNAASNATMQALAYMKETSIEATKPADQKGMESVLKWGSLIVGILSLAWTMGKA